MDTTNPHPDQVAAGGEHPTVACVPDTVAGERIVLRPYRPSDAAAVAGAIQESKAVLARWVPDIARRGSLERVRAGLAQLAHQREAGSKLVFGIWAPGEVFVGEVGLYGVDRAAASAEIGYWLRTSAQGQGLATEAVRLLQQVAMHGLGLASLEAHISRDNQASRRVAERTGFRLVGSRAATLASDPSGARILIYRYAVAPAGPAGDPGPSTPAGRTGR
jgi:RimJ/RimL family protein N-acetyltransferase